MRCRSVPSHQRVLAVPPDRPTNRVIARPTVLAIRRWLMSRPRQLRCVHLAHGDTTSRHAPDLQSNLGGSHGAGCQHCLRRPDLDGIQRRWATADTATGAAGCQGDSRALTQKLHLELPKGGEDVEDQPPGRAGGVDVLVQRPQADATCGQGVHRGQKLAHGSRQSVEPSDDQHITLAGKLQGGGKLRAIGMGAAHRLLEHPFAAGSMESVDLTVSGLEIGRDLA